MNVLKRDENQKMLDQMLLYAKLHSHKPMSSLKETIDDKLLYKDSIEEE